MAGLVDLVRQGLVDPVDAGEAAVFNTASKAPLKTGRWGLQLLQDLVSQFVPSAQSDPMQNLYKMGNVGLSALGGQSMMRTPAAAGQLGALVYHGSPHKFDKFDSSKIGTGEGAQAYGHGLYFAENPQVAKEYQKNLSSKYPVSHSGVIEENGKYLAWAKPIDGPDVEVIHAAATKSEAQKALKQYMADKRGATYRVDLPDSQIAKMLDWDKPLSQQPANVQKLMRPYAEIATEATRNYKHWADVTSGDAYKYMASRMSQADASKALKNIGIPGIKYLDQGSRAGGKGTFNFVVFDDQIPKILGRE